MRPFYLTLIGLALLGVLAGSSLAQTENFPPIKVVESKRQDPVNFEKEILPIFENKCQTCHAGSVKSGQYDMGTYEAMVKGGKRGVAVVPGKPMDSLLIQLSGRTKAPHMPPKKKDEPFTPEELALVKLWIAQGAKGPAGSIVRKREYKLTKLPEPIVSIAAVAVSPDKSLVAASRGAQIHLYDAKGDPVKALINPDVKDEKGKVLDVAHSDLVQALLFSPDNALLASSGFQDVILWDAKTGNIAKKITGFNDRVVALDFSKDGKFLVIGGGAPTEDGELKLIDVAAGKVVKEFKGAHSDTVFGVRFSPDGKLLASCGADKFVKIHEVDSQKFVKSFEGHTHHVMDVGWTNDGKLLASCGADNVVKVWDYEKGEQARTINAHTKQATRLMFVGSTPTFLTAGGDASLKMWNATSGQAVRTFAGGTDFLYAVGVSGDGSVVASGGQDGVLRIYNGTSGAVIKAINPPGATTEPKKP
jgi:WD40 repeat protein